MLQHSRLVEMFHFVYFTLLFGRLRHRNTSYVQHDNIIFLVLSLSLLKLPTIFPTSRSKKIVFSVV